MTRKALTFYKFIGALAGLTDTDQIEWHESSVFQLHTSQVRIDGKNFTVTFTWLQDENPSISLGGYSTTGYARVFEILRTSIYTQYKRYDRFGHGKTGIARNRKLRNKDEADRRREAKGFDKAADDFLKAFVLE